MHVSGLPHASGVHHNGHAAHPNGVNVNGVGVTGVGVNDVGGTGPGMTGGITGPGIAGVPVMTRSAAGQPSPAGYRPPATHRPARIDYDAVRLLRGQVSEALTRWLRNQTDPTEDEIQRERDRIGTDLVARYADR